MRHDPHFVDQLFSGEEISVGRRIAINLIEANPDQPRSMLGDLSDLKASIEEKGILDDPRAAQGGRFTIIAGEDASVPRWRPRLSDVPASFSTSATPRCSDRSDREPPRKDLSPLEEADSTSRFRAPQLHAREDRKDGREVESDHYRDALSRDSASRKG
jgi:hypothetical protein